MASCPKHGEYIGYGNPCPVCSGCNTGRTWSAVVAKKRRQHELEKYEDDPFEQAVDQLAPELDRAWNGK